MTTPRVPSAEVLLSRLTIEANSYSNDLNAIRDYARAVLEAAAEAAENYDRPIPHGILNGIAAAIRALKEDL